jgi:hypothetical protein
MDAADRPLRSLNIARKHSMGCRADRTQTHENPNQKKSPENQTCRKFFEVICFANSEEA